MAITNAQAKRVELIHKTHPYVSGRVHLQNNSSYTKELESVRREKKKKKVLGLRRVNHSEGPSPERKFL